MRLDKLIDLWVFGGIPELLVGFLVLGFALGAGYLLTWWVRRLRFRLRLYLSASSLRSFLKGDLHLL